MIRAARAIDLFVYRIGRELGSLAAALGGLDALVFTAGIGEHAAEVRRRVLEGASWLGVDLDAAANAAGAPRLTNPRVSAFVIPTNEDLMIAGHSWDVVRCSSQTFESRFGANMVHLRPDGQATANRVPTQSAH